MKLKVKTLDAKAKGDIELNDDVFGVDPRADILHRVVNWQRTNARGTARAVRERGDVAIAPVQSSATRKAAVALVTVHAGLRSSLVVVKPTARASVISTRR